MCAEHPRYQINPVISCEYRFLNYFLLEVIQVIQGIVDSISGHVLLTFWRYSYLHLCILDSKYIVPAKRSHFAQKSR